MKATLTVLVLFAMSVPALAQNGQPGAHFIENWDVDGDGVVSLDDITTRRGDVFAAFDADENGALDASEYVYFNEARANDMKAAAGRGNGKGLRRASEGMTLAFNDTNGDGEVSHAEFLSHTGDWMALLDRNSDGSITPADFGRP